MKLIDTQVTFVGAKGERPWRVCISFEDTQHQVTFARFAPNTEEAYSWAREVETLLGVLVQEVLIVPRVGARAHK